MARARLLLNWCFRGLLTASVIGLVLGVPLCGFGSGKSNSHFLLEPVAEDTAEPESDRFEFDSDEKQAAIVPHARFAHLSYSLRVADQSVDTHSAFAGPHRQRAPPLA